jgi:hypothetical protein
VQSALLKSFEWHAGLIRAVVSCPHFEAAAVLGLHHKSTAEMYPYAASETRVLPEAINGLALSPGGDVSASFSGMHGFHASAAEHGRGRALSALPGSALDAQQPLVGGVFALSANRMLTWAAHGSVVRLTQ